MNVLVVVVILEVELKAAGSEGGIDGALQDVMNANISAQRSSAGVRCVAFFETVTSCATLVNFAKNVYNISDYGIASSHPIRLKVMINTKIKRGVELHTLHNLPVLLKISL